MSLIAATFLIAALSPPDVDRDALRAQARMPSMQVSWFFSGSGALKALHEIEAERLLAIKKPTGDQLFQIAKLEADINDDKKAKPYYLRAVARLENEVPRTVVGQSDLSIAYARLGRKADALRVAERLTEQHANTWLSWSTLGVVKVENLTAGQLSGLNTQDAGTIMQRVKSDPKVRAEIQKLKIVSAEAKVALDKGVQLAPLEPEAYRMRMRAGASGMMLGALTTMLDGGESPVTTFADSMKGSAEDGRRVALLTKDPADTIEYVLAGVMLAGMKYAGEHPDEQAEGKVPQVTEGSEKQEFVSLIEGALARTSKLPPAKRALVLKDVSFCFMFLGEPQRAAELASKGAKGLPNQEDAARQHLDILILSEKFAEGARVGAQYAAAHPSWREVRYRTAKCMERQSQFLPALQLIAKDRARNPKDVRTILAEAALRLRLPGYAKDLSAVSDELKLLDALKLDDKDLRTEATFLRAVCLGLAGKKDEAKELLEGLDTSDDSTLADRVTEATKALD